LTTTKKQSRFLWYFSRIRTMSFPELIYRVKESSKKKVDKLNKIDFSPKGKVTRYPTYILNQPQKIELSNIGSYSIFGNNLNYREPINWHRDIMNGKEFPMDFSFSIDTRSGRNGNVKVVWEVNRLQFLTDICLKYIQTKDSTYLDLFISIISSWKKANPYLKGVNWYSNIEVNIRIINWFVCWEILKVNELVAQNSKFKTFVESTWLPLIELHGMHAYRYESKYSSSNNHLIAEGSGLFVAGNYWSFQNSAKWASKGKKILEEEIRKQHSKNGINKEEASEYIQFITDFFLITYLVGERTSNGFSSSYKETLDNIFSYINHLMDIAGHVPYYGDDDDGKVVSLSEGETNNFQSLLASAAVLFENAEYKTRGKLFDLKNQILFGEEGEAKFKNLPEKPAKQSTKLYEDEGHFLIKKGEAQKEIYLHVDVAPLGYLSIAAHGHADALSFFLNIDGLAYVIDPGTYTYHSYPKWRAYFKGTLAHNTIRIDGINQATNGGPCLWVNHFNTKLLETKEDEQEITIKGAHDGYEKLGVTHFRSYTFNKIEDIITIWDEFLVTDQKLHVYELPIHLHPEIEWNQQANNEFEIKRSDKRKVTISLDSRLKSSVVNGQEEPLLGWYSPSFLKKEPTSVIYSKVEVEGSFSLKTELKINQI